MVRVKLQKAFDRVPSGLEKEVMSGAEMQRGACV
jgi:hypothetical protein